MRSKFLIIASVIGIICGWISVQPLKSLGWGNIFLWGIVGIAIGFFTNSKKEMLWSGVLYGYLLFLSFLLFGFGGTPDRFAGFIVFSFGFSIVGAAGGILATWIGSKIKSRFL